MREVYLNTYMIIIDGDVLLEILDHNMHERKNNQ
jgi:hypothetical protein